MMPGSRISPPGRIWLPLSSSSKRHQEARDCPRASLFPERIPSQMDRTSPPPAPPKKRLTLIDLALFGGVAALVLYAGYRVNDVLVYNWGWSRVFNFFIRYDETTGRYVANLLLYGLATTLRLAVWATILASIIGVVTGYWRTSENLTLRILSRTYVELIRNLPPLVFIFIFYYFISSQIFPALGIDNISADNALVNNWLFRFMFGDPQLFSNFLAGVLVLAMFEGAYITEIVRAGIQSIEHGQSEAARAIGLFWCLPCLKAPILQKSSAPECAARRDPAPGRAKDSAAAGGPVHHPDQGFGDRVTDLDPGVDLSGDRGGSHDHESLRDMDSGRRDVFRPVLQFCALVRLAGTPRRPEPPIGERLHVRHHC